MSKEVAKSLDYIKNSGIAIATIIKWINISKGDIINTWKYKALLELTKEELIHALFYDYEIEKYTLGNLPLSFSFEHVNETEIYYAKSHNNEYTIAWRNSDGSIQINHRPTDWILYAINSGDWINIKVI